MRIQRRPLKNKTINNLSSKTFNPKLINHFVSTYLQESNFNNKLLIKRERDNNKLNYIYMALNKTVKFNNYNNNNFININTLNNKNFTKRNNNKSPFLQNIFLVKSLNIDKKNLKSPNNNIKKINMNKYFSEFYNKNIAKSFDDQNFQKIKKTKNNLYNFDNQKIYTNILRLMRIKSNMKYIKQNPYFKDLNMQPSSDKSLFFLNGKKNSKTSLSNNKKDIKNIPKIPQLNIMKKVKNYSNIINNLKNNSQFEETKDKNMNVYNSLNYNPHKQLCNGIKKDDNIIFSYNYIYNKNNNNKILINNKNSKSIQSDYVKNDNDKKYILKNNFEENYRFNYSKKLNNKRRIIFNNFLKNKIENNKNNNVNALNEDLNWSNMSFNDRLNESDSFIVLNPVYS